MSKGKKIALFAIFAAIVIVVQILSTVVGKIFVIVAPTLAFVPILLAVITLGLWQGVGLGAVFSLVAMIFVVTGYDSFSYLMFSDQPVLTILLIFVKGCAAPLVAGLVYNALKFKLPKVSIWITSALLPIVNTGIFCIGTLLFYRGFLLNIFPSNGVFYTVFISLCGINFIVEFFVNLILTPVITDVKKVVENNNLV